MKRHLFALLWTIAFFAILIIVPGIMLGLFLGAEWLMGAELYQIFMLLIFSGGFLWIVWDCYRAGLTFYDMDNG